MKLLKLLLFIGLIACVDEIDAQSVYVTKTGEKYHKSTCHFLKNSKKEISFEKAKQLRFTACSVCKPIVKRNKMDILSTPNKSHTSQTSIKHSESTRCTGKTKSGTRCKRMTQSRNGRCYQHV